MKKNIILPIVSAILVAIVATSIGFAWKSSEKHVAFNVSNSYGRMGDGNHEKCCEEQFVIVRSQKELDEALELNNTKYQAGYIKEATEYEPLNFSTNALIFIDITQPRYEWLAVYDIVKEAGTLKIIFSIKNRGMSDGFPYYWMFWLEVSKVDVMGVKEIVKEVVVINE